MEIANLCLSSEENCEAPPTFVTPNHVPHFHHYGDISIEILRIKTQWNKFSCSLVNAKFWLNWFQKQSELVLLSLQGIISINRWRKRILQNVRKPIYVLSF